MKHQDTAHRRLALVATPLALLFALGACGSDTKPAAESSAKPTTVATASAKSAASSSASATAAVPGLKAGEIPAVPVFSIPSIGVFAQNSDKAIIESTKELSTVPGITVSPAKCDGNGVVSGSTILSGSGAGVTSSDSGSVINSGAGAGVITEGPVSIVYGGEGSGTYTNSETGENITVSSDGSGTYKSKTLSINVSSDGSGTYDNSETGVKINISSSGSGTYEDSKNNIKYNNNGNGGGTYTSSTLNIINNGDGTALVNGQSVKAEKLPPVAKVGKFPKVESLKPVKSCGTVITLQDGVLFDFGKYDLRPEAKATLAKLATVLNQAKVPAAQINGHTDSIGDDAFNQDLSEKRASAVATQLKADGVTANLQTHGYGKTQPVADNTNADGSDNPAGRQANRRVEIYIPAF
ncbi:MAG: OmpA family protein [Actinomyces graevenitzii]|jgi:outer membrane lipoprotein, ompA family|uniref:OmpA family protein n=1 Tax=Actinomyces graevenitzii TaxID=55565 RepID=A0A9E7AFC4_9ACTO|nr:OmpA family protein [Actinomyces graevenitzii]UQF79625.1 MAG: OmpA family protein [Actinomyces graevenitzii]